MQVQGELDVVIRWFFPGQVNGKLYAGRGVGSVRGEQARGPASYNQALSVKRAGAVKAYLVSKGIDANRIYSEGKGETSPVADNSTRSGRSKNRRVEIEVVGAR